ncbi:quinone oxidoreductase family protein [Saprospira grandis]|nr:zinc-binding dehydrogenase [Saprospira grandis]
MMSKMYAMVLDQKKSPAVYRQIEKPSPQADQVLIKVEAAALNHRDLYITQGLYPGVREGIILGSDASGEVVELGPQADKKWLGQKVIVNPNQNWGEKQAVQAKNYSILGMPQHGSFAEYLLVPQDRLFLRPAHLSAEEAAALPLAGLTAYRALFSRGRLQVGERLFISGIGGGVALTALQFAQPLGIDIWVSSGQAEKIEKAKEMGALNGISYKQDQWHKALLAQDPAGFDLIIDSAGGPDFGHFVDLARPAARIVFYGGTRGKFQINPQKMFWKQLDIMGSTMGSDEDFAQMIAWVEEHKIKPLVEQVWPLDQAQKAFDCMDKGQQFGKLVLKMRD